MKENSDFPMRINKYLAHKGISTRKGADLLIEKGKVFINGKKAVLGDKIHKEDTVEVMDSKKKVPFQYFAYYKPVGITTHSPQHGTKDIQSVVPIKGIFPIGRLDRDSEGLIILTNDGRITDRLLNPEYAHEKEYAVRTVNKLRSSFKEKMEKGVNIEGYITKPCKVKILGDFTFSIILTEGKRHQIRRMCSNLFQDVATLKRTKIMNIKLGNLKPGEYRKIEGEELETLLSSLGI